LAVVRVLFRAEFRHRWRSWLLLAMLISVVSGVVLAGAVAARSTATAFPRYEAAHGYDAFLYSPSQAPLPRIGALPEVASSTQVVLPGGGTPTCTGCRAINLNDLSLVEVPPKELSHFTKLVAGTWPDQSDPHQVLASFTLERDAGIHVGTVIRLPLVATSQRGQVTTGGTLVPHGPVVTLRVVGIEAAESEFPATNSDSYGLYTTGAFARRFNARTISFDSYWIRLRHGSADLTRFEADAHALGGASVTDLDTQATAINSSIQPQAVGWWLLAGLAALVGIMVIVQALIRQAIVEGGTFATLEALGVSRRQLIALIMARTLTVGVVGALGSLVVAFLLSPLTPVGEARLADPSPGFGFDPFILLIGGVAVVAIVAALGLWPALRTTRALQSEGASQVTRSSRVVGFLVGAGASPSALIGVRHALERGRGRNSVPVGSALLGAILAVAGLSATAVFGSSLTHLTTTPALYGQPFDVWFSAGTDPGHPTVAQHMLTAIQQDRHISAITEGISGDITINGHTVDALAGQPLRGNLLLTATSGRLPSGLRDIALGSSTLRLVGARVGSLVSVKTPLLKGGTRTAEFRVVGTTAFPPDFGTGGLGTGAVLSLDGILGSQCPPGPTQPSCRLQAVTQLAGAFLVRTDATPSGQASLDRLTRAYGTAVNQPATPANLVNFGQAVNFPLVLGLVLLLFGAATLLHVLVVSVTRRRREMGLLKALGFVRSQLAWSVSWQTTTVALVGIVFGVPLGIAIGRLVWVAFADNLGVLAVPVVMVWVVPAIVVGTLVVANLLAVGPALVASRIRPAALLTTE
jgi:hypothetical protein